MRRVVEANEKEKPRTLGAPGLEPPQREWKRRHSECHPRYHRESRVAITGSEDSTRWSGKSLHGWDAEINPSAANCKTSRVREDNRRRFNLRSSRNGQEAHPPQWPPYQRERARLAERATLEVGGKGHAGNDAALFGASVLLHHRVHGNRLPAGYHCIFRADNDRRWLTPGLKPSAASR